jgi:branched-chain amino acid transport system substrate-binding protein
MFGRHGYYRRARAVALVTASFITCGITALQVATAEPGVDKEQILIGAFGPLTGPASWIGLGARDGMQLAVDEINVNGGVNGRKIRLQYEGAQTPAESVAAVKKLVEQNEVFGLVLGSGSTGAAAAADYLREVQVPSYNIVGATPKIRQPFSRHIFNGVFPSAATIATSFVQEALRSQPKKVAIITGTYELPQALLQSVEPKLKNAGVEIATKQSFDLGAKDFTAQLIEAARTKPDVIIFIGHYTEAAPALRQATELGAKNARWVVDISAISDALPEIAGSAADGVRSIWMFPYYFNDPAPVMRDFEAKWKKRYGTAQGRPNYVDMNGYGDMYVMAVAMRKAGPNLTRARLVDVWNNEMHRVKPSDFGTFASDVIFPESFTPEDHDGNKAYSSLEVVKGHWQVVK